MLINPPDWWGLQWLDKWFRAVMKLMATGTQGPLNDWPVVCVSSAVLSSRAYFSRDIAGGVWCTAYPCGWRGGELLRFGAKRWWAESKVTRSTRWQEYLFSSASPGLVIWLGITWRRKRYMSYPSVWKPVVSNVGTGFKFEFYTTSKHIKQAALWW